MTDLPGFIHVTKPVKGDCHGCGEAMPWFEEASLDVSHNPERGYVSEDGKQHFCSTGCAMLWRTERKVKK